jgi:hypothetical protein
VIRLQQKETNILHATRPDQVAAPQKNARGKTERVFFIRTLKLERFRQCGNSDVPFQFRREFFEGTSESKPHWNHMVASVPFGSDIRKSVRSDVVRMSEPGH